MNERLLRSIHSLRSFPSLIAEFGTNEVMREGE